MNDPLSPGALARLAGELYAHAAPGLRWRMQLRPLICPFRPLIEAVPPDSIVLDAGCGAGLLLALLSRFQRIRSGTGFDASQPAIDAARLMAGQRCGFSPLAFHVHSGFPGSLAGPFDVVCVIDVMHHIPPSAQEHFFRKATGSVRPGGILLYKDMCSEPWWRANWNRLHDRLIAGDGIHYLPVSTVERWAAEDGFSLQQAHDLTSAFLYGHELRIFRRTS